MKTIDLESVKEGEKYLACRFATRPSQIKGRRRDCYIGLCEVKFLKHSSEAGAFKIAVEDSFNGGFEGWLEYDKISLFFDLVDKL